MAGTNDEGVSTMKTVCHCFFRHPQDAKERAAVVKGLEYARSIGDSHGILLGLAQLAGCRPVKEAAK